jgi:hypothetical protein
MARRNPHRLLEAIKLLRRAPAPGRLGFAPDMQHIDAGMNVANAEQLQTWLAGPEPGLFRLIDAGSHEAQCLAEMEDRELVEQVGRFLRICATHFLSPVWERARLTAKTSVFISYRRSDFSADVARRVRERLEADGVQAFLDVQDLPVGASWSDEIEHRIEAAHLFVALVGPDYFGRMGATEPDDDPDVVERELAVALRLRHVPMGFSLDGAKVPARGGLPESVRDVVDTHIQAVESRDPERAAEFVCEKLAGELRARASRV